MPAVITQTTFFFSYPPRQQGWSETFYSTMSPSVAQSAGIKLGYLRVNCMAKECNWIAVRSSIVGPPKDSLLTIGVPVSGTVQPYITQNAETAILWRLRTQTRSRVLALRGVPDGWVESGGLSSQGMANLQPFSDYLTALVNSGFGMAVMDPSNPTKPNIGIFTGTTPGSNALVTNTDIAPNLVDYDRVRIRGCKSNPLYNAVWRVQKASGSTFMLLGSGKFFVNDVGNSTAQKVNLIVDPFNDYRLIGASTRKTGRPFGQPRGRRTAQIRRR